MKRDPSIPGMTDDGIDAVRPRPVSFQREDHSAAIGRNQSPDDRASEGF
jgi:hypothetical protein